MEFDMPKATCKIEGCVRPKYGRGWCLAHWNRWRRNGDPGPVEIQPFRAGSLPGEANHAWRGDDVAYHAVHQRLSRQRGPARLLSCISCGEQADAWAYQHDADDERICEKARLPFTTDLSHYEPMCDTCHNRFDAQHGWAAPIRKGRGGVSLDKRRNRWRAYTAIGGRHISGGSYLTREEAQVVADQLRASVLADLLAKPPAY